MAAQQAAPGGGGGGLGVVGCGGPQVVDDHVAQGEGGGGGDEQTHGDILFWGVGAGRAGPSVTGPLRNVPVCGFSETQCPRPPTGPEHTPAHKRGTYADSAASHSTPHSA